MIYFAGVFFEVLYPFGRFDASVVKHYLVVARNDHLVPELEAFEILKELEEVLVAAVASEVSSVDEDVSVHLRDLIELAVAAVSV